MDELLTRAELVEQAMFLGMLLGMIVAFTCGFLVATFGGR